MLYSLIHLVLFVGVVDGSGNGSAGAAGASKPSSAGASLREAALRALQLCQKGEWPPMDQVLKNMEKAVAAGGEDVNPSPLAGIADVVSLLFLAGQTWQRLPCSTTLKYSR